MLHTKVRASTACMSSGGLREPRSMRGRDLSLGPALARPGVPDRPGGGAAPVAHLQVGHAEGGHAQNPCLVERRPGEPRVPVKFVGRDVAADRDPVVRSLRGRGACWSGGRGPVGPPGARGRGRDRRGDIEPSAGVTGRHPLVDPAAGGALGRRRCDRCAVLAQEPRPAVAPRDVQVLDRPRARREGHRRHRPLLVPPKNAIVLCVDERSWEQALDRTAPILPMRPGLAKKATHDYVRHGTTTLFAALEVATGKVTGQCYDRHRNDEFLRFMKTVAKAYPRRQLHVIADNYATHNHPGVNAWLDKNPRIHTHFTPTSGSWRGLIEVFFGIIQRQAIKRGTFTSDKDVIAAITRFLDRWNQRCEPFTRTKTPDEILAKATRRGTAEARH